jgi:hypothetical protein
MLRTQGVAAGSLDGDINVKALGYLAGGRIGCQGDTAVVAVARQKVFCSFVSWVLRNAANIKSPYRIRVSFRILKGFCLADSLIAFPFSLQSTQFLFFVI